MPFFFTLVSSNPSKFSFQDLPCSLLKPMSKSCCLYGGGRVTSIIQAVRYTPYTSSAKGDFAHDLAISSLHQQFTYVHLFDTHLPRFPRLFPLRSLPKPYGFSSAGWFDNPACTALSMNQLFIIFKRTSWHKQRSQSFNMAVDFASFACIFLRLCVKLSYSKFHNSLTKRQ